MKVQRDQLLLALGAVSAIEQTLVLVDNRTVDDWELNQLVDRVEDNLKPLRLLLNAKIKEAT